ncbi:MAG: DMT family transporter [Alphaproteobacteria bacterium]|nr:DMT family transporter [Alphaproteobacteria bacterium]
MRRSIARLARLPGNVKGLLLILLSTLCVSGMQAMVRHIASDLPPFEIAFFRNLFGLVVLAPLLLRHGAAPLKTERFTAHLGRGVLNALSMLSFFTGVSLTPLANVAALSFTAPLFATIGAILLLKEQARRGRWLALGIGFLGMLTMLRPGADLLQSGGLYIVFSSGLWAASLLIIKSLARTESSLTITLDMGLWLTPLTGLAAAFVWQTPNVLQLAWMLAIGALGTLGHLENLWR